MVRFAAAAFALAALSLGSSAHAVEILLLDFWSPSCGPCMQMKPTIQNFKNAGYPIQEVDTTRDQELPRRFNVEKIPCFVMLVDGQEVDRQVGFTGADRIQQMFARAHAVVEERRARTLAEDGSRLRGQSPDTLVPVQPVSQQVPVAIGPAQPLVETSAAQPYPMAGAAGDPAGPNSPVSEAEAKLLAATVRLRVEDANGHAFGTGTIIDAREGQALVITCGHLFRDSKGKGPVSVEIFEAVPGGVRAAGPVRAQVISYDLDRDVALVGIWPTRPVVVAPVAPKGTVIDRSDRAVSVGCSNGNDPTALATHITWLDRYQGPPNIEATGAPVEGRSGGGLFNPQGQLIGVCFAADYEGNEGLYAALKSIHDELDDKGLSEIYTKNQPNAAGSLTGHAPLAGAPIVRGQEPLTPVAPLPQREPAASHEQTAVVDPASSRDFSPGLNKVEQAAWEEIMTRASTAEVICIIRPKEPGGQSEVITLDDVSPEFVRALAGRQRQPDDAVAR